MESGQERPGSLSVYQMTEIFRKLKNKPTLIDIDTAGDILVKDKDGNVVKTIPVGPYREPTRAEIGEMEEERWGKIADEEEKYEAALERLRGVADEYKMGQISMSALMRANLDMEKADRARNSAVYALRGVNEEDGYEVRRVLFEEKYETRKMPHMIYRGVARPHTLQRQYVRYGYDVGAGSEVTEEAEAAEADEPVMSMMREDKMIIFGGAEENEYGYLSPDFPVEFTLNGVKYFTIDQVMAAEKARTYRDDDVRLKIMKTRSTKMMRVYAEMLDKKGAAMPVGLEGPAVAEAALAAMAGPRPEAAEWAAMRKGLLDAATYAKFRQNPVLEDKLLYTGNNEFVYADIKNRTDGIGLALSDGRVTDKTKWRGENAMGVALASVRSRLRGQGDEMAGAEGTEVVREATITQEAYEDKVKASAKLGSILAARRAAAAGVPR